MGNGVAGLAEFAPMGRKPRRLDRKHEAVRHLGCPLGEGRRRLGTVEGAVDLDRGEVARGVAQLLGMGQPVRIEHAAPRCEGPAADADENASDLFRHLGPLRNFLSLPILAEKAGLSPHGAPSRDHDFELVTPDVRAPLDSWSFWFGSLRVPRLLKVETGRRAWTRRRVAQSPVGSAALRCRRV